jgi:hypothetical protein
MRKAVLLAAAMAVAVSLVGAAGAQAAVFAAPEYPAFVSGGPTETSSMTLGFEGGQTASCEFAGLAGEITGATSELSVSLGFGGCTAFGSAEGSIEANGCAFVFHPGSGSGDKFTGTLDIVCPLGEAITVSGGNCEVQIGSQTGLGPVAYERQTAFEPEGVQASFEMKAASGFAYTKSLDGSGCPLSGTGSKTDGVFGGAMNLKAGNVETFEPIDFRIE